MTLVTMLLILLLGWGGGILVNYLADLLPARERLSAPSCAGCGARQPFANYLLWPRRCPGCGRRRARRTWVVEAGLVLSTFWLWYGSPAGFQGAGIMGFALGFGVIVYFALVAVIDIEHRLILHSTSLVGALLGLAVGALRSGIPSSLIGGLAGFLAMAALFLLGGLFASVLGRLRGQAIDEVAFGFGDVLLGGVIGLMVGWPDITRSLFITILSAGLFSVLYIAVLLILRRYRVGSALPYGPFLILGALVVLFR